MASGQTLLTLAAIVLFMYTALNVNRNYVNGIEQNLSQQKYISAINYGQSIAEQFYAQSTNYGELDDAYGDLDDVTDQDHRLQTVTAFEDTLYATVNLSGEHELQHSVMGRTATITVYEHVGSDYRQRAQYVAAITNMN